MSAVEQVGVCTRVWSLIDDTYQVVEWTEENEDGVPQDLDTLYQGSLSDCEAYIRLRREGLLA